MQTVFGLLRFGELSGGRGWDPRPSKETEISAAPITYKRISLL